MTTSEDIKPIKLYSSQGELLLETIVDDSSYRIKEIMGDNSLALNFSLPQYINLPVGTWCEYNGEKYILPGVPDIVKQHTEHFDYSLTLFGSQRLMLGVKYKFFDPVRQPDKPVKALGAFNLKFPLTATPKNFVQLLVDNMNLKYNSTQWQVGDCVESNPVTLDFNHEDCYSVLNKIAEAFNTEWEVENNTINICKVERRDADDKKITVDLSYGYNNGILGGIKQTQFDDKNIVSRVYVSGGDRNIDPKTYGNSTLLMPKDTTIKYEGIEYKTDPSGSYIERKEPIAGAEDSLDTSKIYPRYEGKITKVIVVDDKAGLYEFVDDTIPSGLDFSQLRAPEEEVTIIFQSGLLSGMEFKIQQDQNKVTGYIAAEKRFILVPKDENGLIYPQGSIIPQEGDTYSVFHIYMPQEAVEKAEIEVRNEAVKYLYDNEAPRYSFEWQLDTIYAKKEWNRISGYLNTGYFVHFSDPQFVPTPVDIRITAVKEFVNNPKSPSITIANNVSGKSLSSVLNEIPRQDVTVDRKEKQAKDFARRRFQDAEETMGLLQESLLNYSESISPITVNAMSMLIGDKSLQFCFVDADGKQVDHDDYYDKISKRFVSASGILQHQTWGITAISSQYDRREWNMKDMGLFVPEADKSYYIYARVEAEGTNGMFVHTEKAIHMESEAGYLHLLMGILNKEWENDRSYVRMYGYTEILPGRITTDKIVSADGKSYFDMAGNRFRVGDNNSSISWNDPENLLKLCNATFEINKKENGTDVTVARIDGDDGSAIFGKGSILLNADGSASFGGGNNTLNSNGSGSLASGNIFWDKDGKLIVRGLYKSSESGPRVEIDPENMNISFINKMDEARSIWYFQEGLRTAMEFNNYDDKGSKTSYAAISNSGIYSNGTYLVCQGGEIYFSYLPTSSKNLSSGRVWRDGDILKIIP